VKAQFNQTDGEYLLIRSKGSAVGYRIENHQKFFANFRKVKPQQFPQKGATLIRDSIINALSFEDSILNIDEQDIVYYFVIG
jgi:hypothetical protein